MSRCTDTCCRPEQDVVAVHIATTRQRANKNYQCDECGGIIVLSTVYDRVVDKVDGEMVMHRRHYNGCREY